MTGEEDTTRKNSLLKPQKRLKQHEILWCVENAKIFDIILEKISWPKFNFPSLDCQVW